MLIKNKLINMCNFNHSNNIYSGGYKKQPKVKKNIFKSNYKVFLIADATAFKMTQYYYNRLSILGINKEEQKNIRPHMTLMELSINREHPDHKFIVDAYGQINTTLRELLNTKYEQLSPQMYINSKKYDYEILGDFLAKVYVASNSSYITEFRMALYKYLEIMLGKSTRKVFIFDNKKYYVYSYNDKPLIAVSEYYHGHGTWKPHISIAKLDKINRSSPSLYLLYQKYGITALIKPLLKAKGQIESLNMSYHFRSLRISIVRG
jgi:hypothetical protein